MDKKKIIFSETQTLKWIDSRDQEEEREGLTSVGLGENINVLMIKEKGFTDCSVSLQSVQRTEAQKRCEVEVQRG